LNLGIRHVLPVYVPMFVLVALGTVKLVRRFKKVPWRTTALGTLAALLVWYGGSTLWVHPSYVAYFNEFMSGPANADDYFTDSSVDWGQDLKRLKEYVDAHQEINHIAVDYFGGGHPEYYFCPRKYNRGALVANSGGYDCSHSVLEVWHSSYGPYTGQYIAVSETYLENDKYFAAKDKLVGYGYLRQRKPVAKIGYSIYLYKLY
jgi:hypothetical protein